MKVRNEDARCESCPYFKDAVYPSGLGMCHRYPTETWRQCCQWCGEHPDFFKEVPCTNTD